MGRQLADELAAVGRQVRGRACDSARRLAPMLAVDHDGMNALGDRGGLIPLDPQHGPYEQAVAKYVHHARGVLDAFGETQHAVCRDTAPSDRAAAGIAKHPLWFGHVGFAAPIGRQEGPMDRDHAGIFLDRDDQRRRIRLGGAGTELAAWIVAGVDAIGDDRARAQIAIGKRAGVGLCVSPHCQRNLVMIGLALLPLARIVVDRREDLARAQRRHDRVGRATGEAMKQDRALADADRQTGGAVGMGRASAHGEVTLPLSAELSDDAVGLFLNRGSLTLSHLRHSRFKTHTCYREAVQSTSEKHSNHCWGNEWIWSCCSNAN
ncbi:conserved hypothetical protein [Sphingomonas aurantiaca]|uniref:Uncharacterized protein n=1 Tax=Sphingomonas aurantiaca TaxID=185949 RepID=A0A5E8AJG1_9SPHN|nr:conserved hypothetical protein [Sphingomonas aurantiaca]